MASFTLRKNLIIWPGRSYINCQAFLTDLISLLTFLFLRHSSSLYEGFVLATSSPCKVFLQCFAQLAPFIQVSAQVPLPSRWHSWPSSWEKRSCPNSLWLFLFIHWWHLFYSYFISGLVRWLLQMSWNLQNSYAMYDTILQALTPLSNFLTKSRAHKQWIMPYSSLFCQHIMKT